MDSTRYVEDSLTGNEVTKEDFNFAVPGERSRIFQHCETKVIPLTSPRVSLFCFCLAQTRGFSTFESENMAIVSWKGYARLSLFTPCPKLNFPFIVG